MDIQVTLFGGLRHFLPPGSSFNKCTLSIEDGGNLSALLVQLPIPSDKPFLVMYNDEKLNPEQYETTLVRADDDIVLLPPIKGG